MEELAEPERVVGDPAHQFAGAGPVMEGEGELLAVIEELLAHPAFDLRTHDMPEIVDEEDGAHLNGEEREHDRSGAQDIGEDIAGGSGIGEARRDVMGEQRQRQRRAGDEHGRREIGEEQRPMRPVIGDQAPEQPQAVAAIGAAERSEDGTERGGKVRSYGAAFVGRAFGGMHEASGPAEGRLLSYGTGTLSSFPPEIGRAG